MMIPAMRLVTKYTCAKWDLDFSSNFWSKLLYSHHGFDCHRSCFYGHDNLLPLRGYLWRQTLMWMLFTVSLGGSLGARYVELPRDQVRDKTHLLRGCAKWVCGELPAISTLRDKIRVRYVRLGAVRMTYWFVPNHHPMVRDWAALTLGVYPSPPPLENAIFKYIIATMVLLHGVPTSLCLAWNWQPPLNSNSSLKLSGSPSRYCDISFRPGKLRIDPLYVPRELSEHWVEERKLGAMVQRYRSFVSLGKF